MEIPVRYSSLRWKKLKQLDVGSHPFVVPDIAFNLGFSSGELPAVIIYL